MGRRNGTAVLGVQGTTIMRFDKLRLVAVAGMLTLTACQLLTPAIFLGDPKKKVTAEFDKLAGSRVAFLVWTDPATLFDYPHARFELATYVGDKLREGMVGREVAVDIVDSRDVEDFLQKRLDAQVDPSIVGAHFRCDYVVFIEVTGFQMRDPAQPQLLRGIVQASVVVHDVRGDAGDALRFRLAEVTVRHPAGGPVLLTATNSLLIREATYRVFAEEVARKFYDYTVSM